MRQLRFQTDFNYHDRETKARYVWLKYKEILSSGDILDVGADQRQLVQHMNPATRYWGIGKGNVDEEIDLEVGRLPYDDGSFDCVLCLDVLEHLEAIHTMFDELCRVSRRYVIISLPNALAGLWATLQTGGYQGREQMSKFYGLPLDPPADRHRWFFSISEAERFVQYRAQINSMSILQQDFEKDTRQSRKNRIVKRYFIHPDIPPRDLEETRMWIVLQKTGGQSISD